ncbi:MAG: phosphatase PAP2 family protein [Armatimonadetes bacterium]|nr:phosphatase PAP2 family protein [Armatimonadota bacterium]
MCDVGPANHQVSSGYKWVRQYRNWLAFALFVIATALCLAFVDTAYERIDEPIESIPLVASIAQMVSDAGAREGGGPILALVVIILAGRRWKYIIRNVVAGLVVQTATVQVLKHLTGRPRPADFDGLTVFYGPGTDFHSFPSSHAAYAFMLATVAGAYFPRWRWLAYGGATVIALSRVMLDRHFISDIMVGAFIGYMAAYLVLRWWPPRESGAETQEISSSSEVSAS